MSCEKQKYLQLTVQEVKSTPLSHHSVLWHFTPHFSSSSVKDFEHYKVKHVISIFLHLQRSKCHNMLLYAVPWKSLWHKSGRWGNKCQCKGWTQMNQHNQESSDCKHSPWLFTPCPALINLLWATWSYR